MARLPVPGQDENTWGDILNEYLRQSHKADGSLKDNTVTSSTLASGAVDASAVQNDSITAAKIVDSTISEDKLDSALQAKVNGLDSTSDHGSLSGLGDDDHPQYHNNTRGDARYYTKSQVDTQLAGKVGTSDSRLTDARTPTAHAASHASAGSDPLSPASIGAATDDDISDALTAHTAASNPHPVYLTQSEGDGRYAQTTDLDDYATETQLSDGLATKANTSHTHLISDVTNLQTSLNGKLDASQRGAANGVASLDANVKVPAAQVPLSLGAVTLTDGASVATNASQGNVFRLAMGGDRTLSAPTNPADGQKAIWEVTASGADRTLTLASGAGGFAFGTTVTALTITPSGTTDYIGAIYNTTANRWRVIAYAKGY